MFNLEQSITEWQRQMRAAGIKTPVPLEELESHLREEVEHQKQSGLNDQRAFEAAVQRMGPASALKAEFGKSQDAQGIRLGKLWGIACGIIAGFFSLVLLTTVITAHSDEVSLAARVVGLTAVATIILSWWHGHKFLPVIRNRQIRTLIGVACCLAGAVWMALFINLILPSLFEHPAGADLRVGRLLDGFLWALTLTAVLGGIAYGLETAVRKNAVTAG